MFIDLNKKLNVFPLRFVIPARSLSVRNRLHFNQHHNAAADKLKVSAGEGMFVRRTGSTAAGCRSGNANISAVRLGRTAEPSIRHKGQSLWQPRHLKGSEYFREERRRSDTELRSTRALRFTEFTHRVCFLSTNLKHSSFSLLTSWSTKQLRTLLTRLNHITCLWPATAAWLSPSFNIYKSDTTGYFEGGLGTISRCCGDKNWTCPDQNVVFSSLIIRWCCVQT